MYAITEGPSRFPNKGLKISTGMSRVLEPEDFGGKFPPKSEVWRGTPSVANVNAFYPLMRA